MKLIIGLGNPGPEYLNSRHNLGFMVLDSLHAHYKFENWKSKFDGIYASKHFGSEKIILVKPQTYMNLSGFCVAKFMQFFKVDDVDIFVIYDDIDLGFGNKKLKQGGGDAGHKGVRSISQHLGTKNFNRIRIGIGRPKEKKDVSSFVLSNFSTTEIDSAQTLIKNLCEDFENIIKKRQV